MFYFVTLFTTMPLEFSDLKNWIQLLLKSTSPFVSGVNEYTKICGKSHSKKAALISDYWRHLIRTILHLTENTWTTLSTVKASCVSMQLAFHSFMLRRIDVCTLYQMPSPYTSTVCQNTTDEHEILGNE